MCVPRGGHRRIQESRNGIGAWALISYSLISSRLILVVRRTELISLEMELTAKHSIYYTSLS